MNHRIDTPRRVIKSKEWAKRRRQVWETRIAGTFGYLAPEYAATGRVTTKVDVYALGVVLMEIITGRKALNENVADERAHLVSWFGTVLVNKDNLPEAINQTLESDEETFTSICKVAELAGHCTARELFQRPDMGHAVSVLSPLAEEWKPAGCHERDEDEGGFGIDLGLSLPDALQRWPRSILKPSFILVLHILVQLPCSRLPDPPLVQSQYRALVH